MKLTLGTVQFGQQYGITNESDRRVSDTDAFDILNYAHNEGVETLDTAALYGESEETIGRFFLRQPNKRFKVITKMASLKSTNNSVDRIIEIFNSSREKLKQKNIYGLMIHDSNDLSSSKGGALFKKLMLLKEIGHVEKIGCSFYNPEQMFKICEEFNLDLVQIPMNLFDQRFKDSGALDYLRKSSKEIYIRSVFLQGLLLASCVNLKTLGMQHAENPMNYLDVFCKEQSVSRLELILHFLTKFSDCNFLMGFTKLLEIEEVFSTLRKVESQNNFEFDFSSLALNDEMIINPVNWTKQ